MSDPAVRRICATLFAAALLAGAPATLAGQATPAPVTSAPATPAQVTLDEAMLPAPQGVASVSDIVIITAPAEAHVRIRAVPATEGGEALAPITFPDAKGPDGKARDWTEVDLTGGVARVPFAVAPPPEPGLYRGTIEVFRGDGTVLGTVEILVQRFDRLFPITVGGTAVKEGTLQMLASAAEADVQFSVKNGSDSAARSVSLAAPEVESDPSQSRPLVSFTPQHFRLAPGQEEQVVAHVSAAPEGVSFVVLRVADAAQPGLYRDVLLRFERSFWARWSLLVTFLLVLVGAALSLVLRRVFPTALAKRRHRGALTEIESSIRLSSGGTLLKSALLAEAGRIRLVNAAVGWYAADREQQIDLIGRLVATLESKRDVAVRIGAMRDTIGTQLDLPFTTVIDVEKLLDQAEDLLLGNHPETAAGKVDEAEARRQSALNDAAVQQLRRFLAVQADKYAALLAVVPPPEWPPTVIDLARTVIGARGTLDALATDELVAREHDATVVQGYLDDFLPALIRRDECRPFQDIFIKLLQTDRGPVAVRPLSQLLQAGLTPDDVQRSLQTQQVDIVTEPDVPFYFSLMQFNLQFRDLQQQGISSVRRLIECKWEFGDGTLGVRAERGQHYYLPLRRDVRRLWFGRRDNRPLEPPPADQADAQPSRPPAGTFVLSCEMCVPLARPADGAQAQTFRITRHIRPYTPIDGHGFSWLEAANFSITALISVLVAYSAQYATATEPLTTLTSWLTPFLFGFGLDQLRNVAAAK